MLKKLLVFSFLFISQSIFASEQIHIVGSSTVYPFVTAAAERFGQTSEFQTPIIESTGTGGGIKLFCEGVGLNTPSFANASRKIKKSEIKLCRKHNVNQIQEIKLGYDGIVVANAKDGTKYKLTDKQIFLALARKVPQNDKLVDNFYKKWSDIDKSLPAIDIEFYGPPPTSGTRDAFVEILMEGACRKFPEYKVAYPEKKQFKNNCHLIREDGAFVQLGENDNVVVQKLVSNKDALGIFGYSFLEQNFDKVQGSTINGVEPIFENISDGSYPISRSLYVYAKGEHFAKIPGMKEFVDELTSDRAVGEEGYLTFRGLVPLQKSEQKIREVK